MPVGADAIYQLVITWKLFGQFCQNVIIFRTKPDSHSDTIDEEVNFLINDTRNWIIDPLRLVMSTDCQLIQSIITTLTPPVSPMAAQDWIGVAGSIGTTALDSVLAGVISLKSNLSARRNNGRIYVPGIAESLRQGDELSDAGHTGLQAAGDSMISRYGIGGTSTRVWGGIYSRANGRRLVLGPPRHYTYDPLTHVPWYHSIARRVIYTNRHRLEGRGI